MDAKTDKPNVIAPPPLLFLSGLILGGFITYYYSFPILPNLIGQVLGNLLIFLGLAIILVAWLQMRKAKTNIEPWKPTTAIVDKGVYGISRNPIYLAMIFVYLGVAFWVNSIWFLLFLPIVLLAIYYGVILREEKYLEEKFGEEYLDYKKRIRRWI